MLENSNVTWHQNKWLKLVIKKTNKRNNVEMMMNDIAFDKAIFKVALVSSGHLKQPGL